MRYLPAVYAILLALIGPATAQAQSPTLADLAAGKAKIVDLAHPLSESSVYWPGDNYEPFRLKTIATLEKNGVLSKAFSTPEHLGTHLDAPNHFERDKPSVDQIPPQELFAEGVLIDATAQASRDPDYRLTLDDVKDWEREHGEISQSSIVLLRTGWGRFWKLPARYKNQDVRGKMHFPGYSAEAARYLLDVRHVRGIGLDTMSMDYGLSTDFVVHHLVNGRGRYGLENLANLDKLPPRGFYLIVAPIKIETGTGGPARVFAVSRD